MDYEIESVRSTAYRNGKLDALGVLNSVIESMKSTNNDPTSIVINNIFDEILRKVETELM